MSSRYSDLHKSPNGPGDRRPTALQIVKDEGLTDKLMGKVFLITGCSSGLGIETAKALATTGATLYLTARNIPVAEKALARILKPGQVELLNMDLSSMAMVRSGAEAFLKKSSKLNVLICNAGVMAIEKLSRTVDGFETHFAVNHLAHFLLFQLLKDTLLSSSSPSFHSRVVVVSSSSHRGAGIRPDDYHYEKRPEEYNPWDSYSQSKTANIYFANEIERRYGSSGLHAISLTPGSILSGIQRHLVQDEVVEYVRTNRRYMKSQEQGAATTVYAAVARELEGKGAVYLEDCEVVGKYPDEAVDDHVPAIEGYAEHAFDEGLERRLWVDSEMMVGAGLAVS